MATRKNSKPLTVTSKQAPAMLQLGDRVEIRLHPGLRGRIVELRGPLGPGGAQIYRVRVRRKPKPTYIELRGDQLAVISAES